MTLTHDLDFQFHASYSMSSHPILRRMRHRAHYEKDDVIHETGIKSRNACKGGQSHGYRPHAEKIR